MLKLTQETWNPPHGWSKSEIWVAPAAIQALKVLAVGTTLVILANGQGFEVTDTPEAILAMIDGARQADALEIHERVAEAMALLEADDEDEDGVTRQ